MQAQQPTPKYYYEDDSNQTTVLQRIRNSVFGEPPPPQPKPKPKPKTTASAAPNASNTTRNGVNSAATKSNGMATTQAPQQPRYRAAPPGQSKQMAPATPNAGRKVVSQVAQRPKVVQEPVDVAPEVDTPEPLADDLPEPPRSSVSSRRRPVPKVNAGIVRDASAEPRRVPSAPVVESDEPPPSLSSKSYESPSRRATSAPAPLPRVGRLEKIPPSFTRETPSRELEVPQSVSSRSSESSDRLLIARKSPNINIETSGPRRISVGKEAAYQISVENAGELAATDIVVYVDVPPWAQVAGVQASAGTSSAKAAEGYQWRIANLPSHSRQELTLKIVPLKSQAFELGVRWTTSPTGSQAMVEVQEPKLQMAITGPSDVSYGQQQVYKLTIMNPGTGDAEGVMLHLLPINPGEGATASHRLGTLSAGASKSVEIELTARQAGRITIKAEATADGDLKTAAVEEVIVRRPQLQVLVSGPKVHYAGAPASYEVRVKNPGDAAAHQVNVAAVLPSDVDVLASGQSGQFDASQHRINWSIESLAASAEQTFTFKCIMRSTGANRIEAVAQADGELKDANLVNTQILAVADLALDVSDSPGPIPVGQEMTYEIRIRNRGTNGADQVEAVAFFSQGLEPVSVEGGFHEIRDGAVIFKPLATVPPGGEAILKINARAVTPGSHRIRVEVQCKSLGTQLTSEDTTLFYAEDGSVNSSPPQVLPRQ